MNKIILFLSQLILIIAQNCQEFICKQCNQYTQDCIQCHDNYYLYKGQCFVTCPDQFTGIDNSCVECDSQCLKCSQQPSNCTECIDKTKYLSKGKCIDKCDNNQFNDNQNICYDCTYPCKSCSVTTFNCTSCQNWQLFLQQNQCVISCSIGFYPITQAIGYQTKICKPCQISCIECQGENQCLHCASQFFFFNYTCLDTCPKDYRQDQRRVCQKINEPSSCPQNQVELLDGSCKLNCNEKNFLNYQTRKCLQCHKTCVQCTGPLEKDCISQ